MGQGEREGRMIMRVSPPALSHLRAAVQLAGPARPVVGLKGRRAARPAARGRRALPHQFPAPARLGRRPVLAALIRLLPARLRAHRLVTPAPSCGGTAAWYGGQEPGDPPPAAPRAATPRPGPGGAASRAPADRRRGRGAPP